MADTDAAKSLSGLLNGITQKVYYSNPEITEELLKNELYPEMSQDEFSALHEKMRGLLKSIASADMDQGQLDAFLTAQTKRRQGGAGLSSEQAAVLTRFWKTHRPKVREALLNQSRWEPALRGVSWRVDVQAGDRRGDAAHSGAVALVEIELGRTGESSEFVCLEMDESKVNLLLKKMADIQQSIDRIVHRSPQKSEEA
ncbi:COMM domain-containing protein 1 [Boleophthalmus pectinirostris]|uniref:COMM domain-containing protein 1 n=1 Tax=Boleophthalmus pectinirostris TaxID=150288 RepID=UPI00242C0A28|nr:COMM domain-containing protein 1 [Boleophthalmus pectinirostris]